MTQTAEDFKILSEDEQDAAYKKAKREFDEKEANWLKAQESFLDENVELRDPDLNAAFIAAVNDLIVTDEGIAMTDRQVLESAYVRVHLKGDK